MRRSLITCVLVLAALLGVVASASAHAVLEGSSPARGAQLEKAPARVTFTFNEPVEASLGAVQVFDTEGAQVQSGDLERPGGDAEKVGAELPGGLADGLYTATYRVISADAHPITGGMTFTVGDPVTGDSRFTSGLTISELLAESGTGKVTEVGFWFDRWIGYLALALALGSLVWMLACWLRAGGSPESTEAVAKHFRRLILTTAGIGLLASLLAIPFQGAVATGSTFWSAFGSGIPGEVIHTRFGTVMLVRSAAWLAVLLLAFAPARMLTRPSFFTVVGLVGAAALAVTPALAGHASTRDPGWLILPSDVTHVAAMAIWSGGLAAMLLLLPAGTRVAGTEAERTRLLTRVTLRFSGLALIAVVLVGVTGSIQAIVEVGSVPALVDTAFGRAVAIKIALFAVLVGLGAANRRRVIPSLVRRLDRDESPGEPGFRLRRMLRIEVLLVVCVLGVSAALVSYPPPDAIQAGPISGSVNSGPDRVEYTVDPGQVGSNSLHVYVFNDQTGAPVPVISMEIAFSLPESGVSPIDSEARRAGPGHFVIPAAMFGIKGDWKAEAAIRVSTFTERMVSFEVPIR